MLCVFLCTEPWSPNTHWLQVAISGSGLHVGNPSILAFAYAVMHMGHPQRPTGSHHLQIEALFSTQTGSTGKLVVGGGQVYVCERGHKLWLSVASFNPFVRPH